MFCKERADILVKFENDEYYVFFNYDFKPATIEEQDAEGNLITVEGYECESIGKIYLTNPDDETLIQEYYYLGGCYNLPRVEQPQIVRKAGEQL